MNLVLHYITTHFRFLLFFSGTVNLTKQKTVLQGYVHYYK